MSGRVACLLVPRFAVAALLRAEPELRGTPLVVTAGSSVVDVSAEAQRAGAQPGLTIAQALIRHADLVVRPLDVDAVAAARAALADGIVADADLVDAGAIFGTGFAPFRGGPLHYAGRRPDEPDRNGTLG